MFSYSAHFGGGIDVLINLPHLLTFKRQFKANTANTL